MCVCVCVCVCVYIYVCVCVCVCANSHALRFSPHHQVSVIRRALALQLQNEEAWREAATVLIGIPLESGHR